ncbi:MAG TPA: DUF4394 domain-containing protein [Gemmatimonadales bacterium]|nr:DUF4394 domain-containing protein [Gemmatimonadales bacterium]
MRPLPYCYRLPRIFPLLITLALSLGCGGDSSGPNPPAQGKTIYAVDLSNTFELFHSGIPGTVNRQVAITGLLVGDRIVGIDFRPADGKLYGVGTDSRVYVVDSVTAVASPVGPTFTPALNGEHFGVAIDPTTDEIRIQSAESGQNLRLSPVTGAVVATDAVLAYAAGDPNAARTPEIAATAITTTPGAATTYGIDWFLDQLVIMPAASDGQVTTIGSTGVSTSPCAALDMGDDGVLYATMTINTINQLYTMNLGTGEATSLGSIPVVASIQSIAVAPGAAASTGMDQEALAVEASGRASKIARVGMSSVAMGGSKKTCR